MNTMVSAADHVNSTRMVQPVSLDDVIADNGTQFAHSVPANADLRWGVLVLSCVIVASILGNVLVCLAVCWEKRLQNMTNFFLMSLAIADLLVSVLVMPFAMVVELYGE